MTAVAAPVKHFSKQALSEGATLQKVLSMGLPLSRSVANGHVRSICVETSPAFMFGRVKIAAWILYFLAQ